MSDSADVDARVVVSRKHTQAHPNSQHVSSSGSGGPVKKRAKMWMKEIDDKSQEAFDSVTVENTLRSSIERKLHQCAASATDAAVPVLASLELDLDHVLSQLPYQSILENYFSSKKSDEHVTSNIPVITKAYEESFMRQVVFNFMYFSNETTK